MLTNCSPSAVIIISLVVPWNSGRISSWWSCYFKIDFVVMGAQFDTPLKVENCLLKRINYCYSVDRNSSWQCGRATQPFNAHHLGRTSSLKTVPTLKVHSLKQNMPLCASFKDAKTYRKSSHSIFNLLFFCLNKLHVYITFNLIHCTFRLSASLVTKNC